MEMIIRQDNVNAHFSSLTELLREMNLTCYASDAAFEMRFNSPAEFHESVHRAMKLCLYAGIAVDENFKRVYRCSENGIVDDWKLSPLAYRLVCLNGSPSNCNVARMQLDLIEQTIH